MNKLSRLTLLTLALSVPVLAQTNVQSTAETKSELKQDSKANKAQAKADKAQRKALNTKEQKKADKAQDKADRQAAKTALPPQ